MMNLIRVTSGLERPIRGRYDGKDYVFVRGKPVELTLEAAAHIFGLGKDDKRQALNQLGWLRPDGNLEEALEKLEHIKFEEGHVAYDDDEPLPGEAPLAHEGGDPRRRRGRPANRIGDDAPTLQPGGESGADGAVAPEDSADAQG